MPAVHTDMEYLQDVYTVDKPYWRFKPPEDGFDPEKKRLSNLEFEWHQNIKVHDIRDAKSEFTMDECGFEVLHHPSEYLAFETPDQVFAYRKETEKFLTESFGAVFVKCYNHGLRKNVIFERTWYDMMDPLVQEGPAQGVHIDVTFNSGPEIIQQFLSLEEQQKYLRPGYRFRIVNTWRSLLPVLEDRPLALCDSRSVATEDLVPCDRVVPDHVGEVYFLKYNPNHKWYWLEHQTSSELLAFVMYDTKEVSARFCPHVSFINPRAPEGSPARESIETRSIIITRE